MHEENKFWLITLVVSALFVLGAMIQCGRYQENLAPTRAVSYAECLKLGYGPESCSLHIQP